jgi:transposase InsO family protein
MRAEFFRAADGQDAMLAELQAALDGWVAEYNATRPHQSCGGRPSGSARGPVRHR